MEYLTFILHILALLSISSIIFVPEESRYIPKLITFILLFISIVYNRVFICECIKGFWGTCSLPKKNNVPMRTLSSAADDYSLLKPRLDALKK